jgi:hypothetical protein
MKKILLSVVAAAAVLSANAQQRLVLYEEFSGENCGPCATYNPGLMTLLAANSTKAILVKYQSPIPSAGPIYGQNTADVDARLSYYAVNSAPNGRIDGANGDNIANHNQADIDAAYNLTTPFTMTTTHSWSSDADSIFITVVVTATGGPFTGASMYLRTALVEHLVYDSPPGSNGETDFKNVMREMYPISGGALGTSVPATWTMGQTATYTLSGPVPSYVDKSDPGTFVVAWLQNDATKTVAQASKSTPVSIPVDVKSDGITVPTTLVCASGTSTTVVPTVAIKNTGTVALTSATVYSKVDNGAWTPTPWTGNLAAGATANFPLAAVTLTVGSHFILDSLAMPNSAADVNLVNNVSYVLVNVASTTVNPLSITTGFENAGQNPTGWITYDANANGQNIFTTRVTGQNYGHNNSTYFLYHNNFGYLANEANYAIIPTPDMTGWSEAVDFWVASAPYTSGTPEPDKLEIVWSNNCGQSWTSIWSQQGAALNTAAATTNPFIPSVQANWQQRSVNISSIPAGAIVAFRATSGYGNNLFIDDVNVRVGSALGVEAFTADNANMNLFPNPATDKATLSFSLTNSANVQVSIVDALGRTVANVVNSKMDKGQQTLDISTANYAPGVYNVIIKTDAGTATQRLTVTK